MSQWKNSGSSFENFKIWMYFFLKSVPDEKLKGSGKISFVTKKKIGNKATFLNCKSPSELFFPICLFRKRTRIIHLKRVFKVFLQKKCSFCHDIIASMHLSNGKLISKCLFAVYQSTNKTNKKIKGFLP